MTVRRKVVYLLLAVAVCLLAPRVRLYPTDDLRIARAFIVMDGGHFHHARPHLARAYAAFLAGCLPDDQATGVLVLYGLMLERGGQADAAAPILDAACQRDPAAAGTIELLRRELP